MQCSYLLSFDFKISSLSDWDVQFKIIPLYAILIGFAFSDTPGVGTFYDFLGHMWDSDVNHLFPLIHPLKKKAKKSKTKEAKAGVVEKIKVQQLLPGLKNVIFDIKDQPHGSHFMFYQNEFLNCSASKELINPKFLALASAGTPVITPHKEPKHHIGDCVSKDIATTQYYTYSIKRFSYIGNAFT